MRKAYSCHDVSCVEFCWLSPLESYENFYCCILCKNKYNYGNKKVDLNFDNITADKSVNIDTHGNANDTDIKKYNYKTNNDDDNNTDEHNNVSDDDLQNLDSNIKHDNNNNKDNTPHPTNQNSQHILLALLWTTPHLLPRQVLNNRHLTLSIRHLRSSEQWAHCYDRWRHNDNTSRVTELHQFTQCGPGIENATYKLLSCRSHSRWCAEQWWW